MDNTTFGGDIPSLPQWTGPPYAIIQVQAMLYASLAASLFSAFLAMLGKQWLNRYASMGMRGTGIERSQDRQRKLNGIVTWCFDYVMESLPLMLQLALLLLGCALSLYLWEIDMTVARVVVGVTALGVVFYVFFVVAGTASASCPYQTPGAHILRHILHYSNPNSFYDLLWKLSNWILSIAPTFRLNQRAAMLDSECISWVLQTSLEKGIRLSTLQFLATTPALVDFTPALVSDCFDVLIDCIKVNEDKPVVVQGMEQLAEESAMCFFLTYSHLSMSDTLLDVRYRYRRAFPRNLDFSGLSSPHALGTIHEVIYSLWKVKVPIEWRGHKPTNHEHAVVAHAISKLSWDECHWYNRRVPPLCLSFALHHLSQDPLPPPSVIASCLLIVATDLGCSVPKTTIMGERFVRLRQISTTLLTKIQCPTRGDF
jgi:hypothetical protein